MTDKQMTEEEFALHCLHLARQEKIRADEALMNVALFLAGEK